MRSITVRRFHTWGLVLAVSALCTMPALAQASRGEFTIKREIHWGDLVLPAGSYTYSVEHHAAEVLLLRSKAGGAGHFLFATSVTRTNAPALSHLTIEQRGAAWYVTAMVVDDLGEAFLFRVPSATTAAESGAKLAAVARK
jgi:hypothetical protein